MYSSLLVYGILEKNRHFILSSASLNNIKIYASRVINNYLENAIYGVPCFVNGNTIYVDEDKQKEVNNLYEKLVRNGRSIEIGIFCVVVGNFYISQKEYIPEEDHEDEKTTISESIVFK